MDAILVIIFVFMGIFLMLVAGAVVVTVRESVVEGRRRKRVMAEGTPGIGTVMAARDLGGESTRSVEFTLAVTCDGRTWTEMTVKGQVAPINLAYAVPGAHVPVMVDPDDPDYAAIDWSGIGQVVTARTGRPGGVRLGVFGVGLDAVMAGRLGARPGSGLLILTVADGSPAQRAGVQPGDLLLAVDDAPVASPEELVEVLEGGAVGQPLSLTVLRDGASGTLKATLAAGGG